MKITLFVFGREWLSVTVAGQPATTPDNSEPDRTTPDEPDRPRPGFWGGSGGTQELAWLERRPVDGDLLTNDHHTRRGMPKAPPNV